MIASYFKVRVMEINIMNKIGQICFSLVIATLFYGCSTDEVTPGLVDPNEEKSDPVIESKEPVEGIRIAWDYQTLREISDADHHGYNGYARLVQLHDNSLIAVYESNGNVVVKKSEDLGNSWEPTVTVARLSNGVNMATPDIIQLEDNSILVTYNPRPTGSADPTSRFAIRTVKSYDGGSTWKDYRLVYEADTEFGNGAWEPSAVQLPSGEVQVFFSNENIYRTSGEQNISLIRSYDNGLTWKETPEIASFTKGSRDGMPSPLLLKNGNEIVVAIEDNSENYTFKPHIVRTTIAENWNKTVGGDSPNRNYALKEPLAPSVNAAAPYLAQLNTGETLLSYQGTEGRWSGKSDMKVVIGNDRAYNFNRKSVPFPIPDDESAIWNSIAVLEDNSVIAVTSTGAYSSSKGMKIWMIKGYVIPEIEARKSIVDIDGTAGEELWNERFPVFIGGKGSTQLYSNFAYDEEYLYVLTKVKDDEVISSSSNLKNNDGVTIYLDPQNKSWVTPGPGIFKIVISASNEAYVYEGDNKHYTGWTQISANGFNMKSEENAEGYIQEMAIPWDVIGGKPAVDNRLRINFELAERGNQDYDESISSNETDKPYSWSTLKLKE